MPLIFNGRHASIAVPIIERTVFEIMKDVPPPPGTPDSYYPATRFQPWMICQLLSTLMNTMVVQLMKDVEKEENRSNTYASEKALEGYCAFHHMLLYFAHRYPSIVKMTNHQVDTFISSESHRHKRYTPNLGTLLVCLTLSDTGWGRLWKPLILESFDRNVRWLLQKHPKLGTHGPSDDERIRTTFYGSRTSLRLLMFQVYFTKHIGRPQGARGFRDVLVPYEKRLGRPTTAQKEDLQEACKAILAVDSWNEFCSRCALPPLTMPILISMLHQAVINSRRKKYHYDGGSTTSVDSMRPRGGPSRRR